MSAPTQDALPDDPPDAGKPPGAGKRPDAAATPFERLGGEPAVRALVDRFYDLMELEPALAGIRALHPTPLGGSRDKLHWFLCGWLGGPNHYVDRFGHPMLRARHLPFAIGIRERDQWLACMGQAMTDQAVDPALAQRLAESFLAPPIGCATKGVERVSGDHQGPDRRCQEVQLQRRASPPTTTVPASITAPVCGSGAAKLIWAFWAPMKAPTSLPGLPKPWPAPGAGPGPGPPSRGCAAHARC